MGRKAKKKFKISQNEGILITWVHYKFFLKSEFSPFPYNLTIKNIYIDTYHTYFVFILRKS